MSTHRESSVKRYRTHSTFRMESSGITATMSLRLQATEEWENFGDDIISMGIERFQPGEK